METAIFEYLTEIAIQIGAILFLIFGVRTLFKLYNYNMKMYAFYNAKADAIELQEKLTEEGAIDNIQKTSDIFTPKDITFDKMPEHPYKDFINMSKKALEKQLGIDTDSKKKKKAKASENGSPN